MKRKSKISAQLIMTYQPVSQAQHNIVAPQAESEIADDHLLPSKFRPMIESRSAGSSRAVATMKDT